MLSFLKSYPSIHYRVTKWMDMNLDPNGWIKKRSISPLQSENCFSDIDNFTMTQITQMPPAVVNYHWANQQQLTAAGASGS